jgi:D-alanine-D-alanine ligase
MDPVAAVQSEEVRAAELVFVALHGGSGEDGRMQALLELAGKLYVGSGPTACALSMDKLLSKHLMRSLGIPTPPWRSIPGNTPLEEVLAGAKDLGYPLVFKPVSEGSAIGVAIDPSEDQLREIWQECGASTGRWMLERYIPGRELTLPMVAGRCTPLVEILPKEGFYDYQNKYTPGRTEYRCPAEVAATVEEEIRTMGLLLWKALDLRDMARMDLRLDEEGRFWFLEINTIPGMTQTSLLPMGAKEIGLSFTELCQTLCAGPLERARQAPGGTP